MESSATGTLHRGSKPSNCSRDSASALVLCSPLMCDCSTVHPRRIDHAVSNWTAYFIGAFTVKNDFSDASDCELSVNWLRRNNVPCKQSMLHACGQQDGLSEALQRPNASL